MRKKIDHAAVVAAYAEIKNGREVGRRLGIHENTVYQIVRIASGNCSRCGAKSKLGRTSCEQCLTADRARLKRERAKRKRLGICQSCDKQRSPISTMFCEEHRIATADRSQRSKLKFAAAGSMGTTQGDKQRLQHLRWKYGPDAEDCWRDAGGKCEICHQPDSATILHIHHIDESKTNHERANLICLCHNCHTTVHGLLRSSNPKAMTAWFASTYSAKWAA